jgi:hypothetical protein
LFFVIQNPIPLVEEEVVVEEEAGEEVLHFHVFCKYETSGQYFLQKGLLDNSTIGPQLCFLSFLHFKLPSQHAHSPVPACI